MALETDQLSVHNKPISRQNTHKKKMINYIAEDLG